MMRNLTTVGCLSWVLYSMSAPAYAAERPTDANFHYHYFKERRPLTLDAARVAVLFDGVTANAAPTITGTGLADRAPTPLAIRGWYFAETQPQAASATGVKTAVTALAAQPAPSFASPVFVGADGGPVVITPTLLIGFRTNVPKARAEAILAEVNAGVILDRDWANMRGAYRVRSAARDGFTVLDKANALARRDEVLYAEPNIIFTGRSELIPNDTFFGDAWGIHNTGQSGGMPDADMDGPEAWDITTGDPSIKVLIIDNGAEQTHPDLNQLPGLDVTSEAPGAGGGPVNVCDNHGTAVSGCVSGIINNALGAVGIAPTCKTVSVRFAISTSPACDGTWSGESSYTVAALAFGESVGVRVTNNSNGYGGLASAAIASKYAQTRADGMVHFASAGNGGTAVSGYPASLPAVNSIAAMNRFGNRASFSSFGPDLFISAPGQTIISTDRTGGAGYVGGDYVLVDGTSFSSPYTAGVAALVLSVNPARPSATVESILASSAVDLGTPGWDSDFGWGFVNARQAVLLAQDVCNDPGPPDCNGNTIVDSCDLYEGTSADCNFNAVPDDCESAADCQPNGIRDICEIGTGASRDCNANAVPDECDIALGAPDCQPNEFPDACDNLAVGSIVSTLPAVLGFTDISATGTPLNLADDASANVLMPFASAALGTSTVSVSNNGGIGLVPGTELGPVNNQPIPHSDAFGGQAGMLVYWDDLDSTTGNVYHRTIGSTPAQTFIVQWHNRPHFAGDGFLDGDEVTFQVQIFETPVNDIVAQYLYADTDFDAAGLDDGRSATVGFQRALSEAYPWSFNTAGSVTPAVVLSLLRGDRNNNGQPDACESLPSIVWDSNDAANRALVFNILAPVTATGGLSTSALKVTMVDLQHLTSLLPPGERNRPQFPPPDFTSFDTALDAACVGGQYANHHCHTSADCVGTTNGTCTPSAPGCGEAESGAQGGCARWVGPPQVYMHAPGVPARGTWIGARLQCTPYYTDWSALPQKFAVFGADIVSSSEYSVTAYASDCKGNEAACINVSVPATLSTRRWGDVGASFNPPATTTQPDGNDVGSAVNLYFRPSVGMYKPFGMLQPSVPPMGISVGGLDIGNVVSAFQFRAYPFTGPCPCPSDVTCAACSAGSTCPSGQTCQKRCSGGPHDLRPCDQDMDCGLCTAGANLGFPCAVPGDCGAGGVCDAHACAGGMSGVCVDACGRCD